MMQTQPLEVIDFSGGITDYFVDGETNTAEEFKNFFYTNHKRPRTRWGSDLFITTQLPSGLNRVSLIDFVPDTLLDEDTLVSVSGTRLFYDNAGVYAELLGPTNRPLFDQGDSNSLISTAHYQGQILMANDAFSQVQRVYFDENQDLQVRSAGLPDVPDFATGDITDPSGSDFTYSYAFIFSYTYQVGDTTYLDRGPVTFFPRIVSGGEITAGNGSTITLPSSFSGTGNYDTDNLQIEIYRTQNGADDYFRVGTVPFTTLSFVDEVEDETLVNNTVLYGDNGRISNSAPPLCKYVHVVNNTGYYAHTQEGSAVSRYTVHQSIPGDPDSVPKEFTSEVEQEIFGLSSIFDRPMLFCRQFIYRIDQFFGSDGNGSMDLRRIDDRAGCVSNNSIVQTHKGIFWAGEIGFYWSDGYKVMKISDSINETYQKLVSNTEKARRIQGTYDPNNERVIWSVNEDGVDDEPNKCFVLDLRFGIRAASTFTTMDGGDSFRPTAIKFHKDPQTQELRIYRGDTRGLIFYHEDSLFSDRKVDLSIADPANWINQAIIYSYKSCFHDFGSKFYRKFVPRILISAENTTNLSLAIKSSNDSNRVVGDLQPITYNQSIVWGSPLPIWGDARALWNFQGIIEQWRRFPAGSLRCQYKQIQLTNAESLIVTSDLIGNITVDGTNKTATLGGVFTFPDDVEDYFITLENDNYTERFLISSRTSNQVVLEDPDDILVDGNFKFSMVGIPKNEVLVLNGYVLHWSYLSKSHTPFTKGSNGSNPE